eukprot:g28106.t1
MRHCPLAPCRFSLHGCTTLQKMSLQDCGGRHAASRHVCGGSDVLFSRDYQHLLAQEEEGSSEGYEGFDAWLPLDMLKYKEDGRKEQSRQVADRLSQLQR